MNFAEWPTVFFDEKMTIALFDRLALHYHTIESDYDSYRFRNPTSNQVRETRQKNPHTEP